ncbi:MAG: TonB-dependent receptor [Campylobacterota bacterium]
MSKTVKLSLISVALLSQLNAAEVLLEQITVVSATKSKQSLKDVTSNVNVITSGEIEEKHYTTVTEALNSVAGINYTSNGGLGSTTSLNLRGAGNNRTLVLVDGVSYQDPSSTSGASIQHLMIQDIERIEVIKGAQSGIWGADASTGVINIITKKAKEGTHVNANLEGGSFHTRKVGATVSHKTSDFDVKLSVNEITSDGFTVQAPRDEDIEQYEDDAYSNLTVNLQANYNINDDAKIGLNITDIDALKEYDRSGPDDDTMKSDVSDRLYKLAYLQTYDNHSFTLKAELSNFSRDEIGTTWGVKNFNGKHTNIELIDNMAYYEKDFVTFGLGSSSDNVDYVMADNSNNEKKNKDNYIYLTNSNNFGPIILTESIRYDDYDNFDSKVTGKLGVKYNFNENIFITSNIGLGYNVPSIVQELNPWGAVNNELNPEDTISSDISIGYKNIKATYFYNEITDLIEWYDPNTPLDWSDDYYKNLDGKSIFKGYEFEYSQNITDTISLSLNYSILSAKDKGGKDLARRAKETAKLALDYYPLDDLHLGIFGEYIGERYDGADKGGEQTGRYIVVDFVANYDINKNLSLYTKVDNLFDKYYQTVDGYATAPLSGYLGLNAKF